MSHNLRGAVVLSAVAVLLIAGASMIAVVALLAGGTSAVENFWFATANQLVATASVITSSTAAALLVRRQVRSAGLLAAATGATVLVLGGLRLVVLAQVLENIDPRQQAESTSGILYSVIGTGAGLILLPIASGIGTLIASRPTAGRARSRARTPVAQTV